MKKVVDKRAEFAKGLRKLMFSNNEMTAMDLAEKYGCSKQFAHRLRKNGADSDNVADKVAEMFNTTVDKIIKMGEV